LKRWPRGYLRQEAPEWRVRVVNVIDLLVLGIPQKYPQDWKKEIHEIVPLDCRYFQFSRLYRRNQAAPLERHKRALRSERLP